MFITSQRYLLLQHKIKKTKKAKNISKKNT